MQVVPFPDSQYCNGIGYMQVVPFPDYPEEWKRGSGELAGVGVYPLEC